MFLIFIILWNRKSWLNNFMLLVTLVCKKKKYEWEYASEISRGANNCGQHSLEKNNYFIMRFSPHFQLFYFNDRLELCDFFEWKIKRINNADLFSQPPLLIFIKGAIISGGHCVYMYNEPCVLCWVLYLIQLWLIWYDIREYEVNTQGEIKHLCFIQRPKLSK